MTLQRAGLRPVVAAVVTSAILTASGGALACAMCLSAFKVQVSAQEFAYAKRVVLATQVHPLQYRVVDVIKGDAPAAGVIDESVARVDPAAAKSGKPLLLIRDDKWTSWVSLGVISAEHAAWLRQLAASKDSTSMVDAEREAQVASMLPLLENSEPMVAEIAFGEIAGAPYSAMRANKAKIDVKAVRGWLADPALVSRRSLYVLLLGIAGDGRDVDQLERQLDSARRLNDATHVSALLAADLELRGPARVAWIETHYILDPKRTPVEIQAAMLALSEQGDVDRAVPRARVIQSYRLFIRERKSMAGLVAQHLAEWDNWDAVPEYVAILKSGVASPTSRYAIVNYLQRSPRADAQAALKSLAIARQ